MNEKKWLYDFRILVHLFFIICFILSSIPIEAKVINGIDIPEEFIAKIEKYRFNYHQDCCVGGRGNCDFWIKELDFLLKKKIKMVLSRLYMKRTIVQ